jgi:hypothetical protein
LEKYKKVINDEIKCKKEVKTETTHKMVTKERLKEKRQRLTSPPLVTACKKTDSNNLYFSAMYLLLIAMCILSTRAGPKVSGMTNFLR